MDLKSFWATLPGQILGLAALVTAITTLVNLLWRLYTALWDRIGRRRTLTRKLRQLSCEVNINVFEYHLGIPPQYVNSTEGTVGDNKHEYIFVLDDVYVQAIAASGRVICFSVTTRRQAFHPVLEYYGAFPITLGRTRFQDFGDEPSGVQGWLGARRWGYGEAYYYGNPGGYQTYVYSINDAGADSGAQNIAAVFDEAGYVAFGLLNDSPNEGFAHPEMASWLDRESVRVFRQQAVINTVTVVGPQKEVRSILKLGFAFGPNLDQVRLLPKP